MEISSGFLPTGSLLDALIHVSIEVASMEKLPFVQIRNVSTLIRRVKLLSSLFEEIQEEDNSLPPSSILCLTELFSVIRRVKLLIQGCKDGSSLWGLMQVELISNQFYMLVKEMGKALDVLPLSLLKVTVDIREQVELLHKQAKRVELFIDPQDLQRREELLQENAVTALSNLSIFDNRILIMAAGAVNNIMEVLESEQTMAARENAAAAIFSLSILDDCKVTIGACPRVIPALVGLLREGTPIGKKDAATALFNLAVYNPNKVSIVFSGAVPLLQGCSEGLEETKKSRVLMPLLIDLLRFGSAKGKENSITLLLGLRKEEGELVARRLLANPRSIPSLQSLTADGSLRARRKADALLRLLNKCCSQSHNSI
ncbi:RING-type E3 ubiquitin transferase [Quillaja saponaria]|uniref:RING-type E3 ubiquitin transferase n=1 Tax=Quillaja saponaria TaxID=32244 RepID=A0AAD7PL53_QUISA|nr:RING-type E3 ubiquitin transferase [Quillaja saponaria]